METRIVLENKLKEIRKVIREKYESEPHLGVLAGLSGIALFEFYYDRFLGDDDSEFGEGIIVEVVNRINEGYTFPTFCTGIAGAGWAIEHLQTNGFIEVEADALLSPMDEYLFEVMKVHANHGYFDFMHGALGKGIYFLHRYQKTESVDLKKVYTQYLRFLIDEIRKASKQNENGIFWEYDLKGEQNIKGVNLGLSHGMASMIGFLSKVYLVEEFREEVKEMLEGAVQYMISCQYDKEGCVSLFPSWVHEGMEPYGKSRLGWCYGDLGIGVSLWNAGKVLDNDSYKELAMTTIKNSCARRDLAEGQVKDGGLCHGAFGIVAIFDYMYRETKDQGFKETADFWMQEAIKMDTGDLDSAGYKMWRGAEQDWEEGINLLEGIAGMGLAILSYLDPTLSQWDECLLIH